MHQEDHLSVEDTIFVGRKGCTYGFQFERISHRNSRTIDKLNASRELERVGKIIAVNGCALPCLKKKAYT